MVLVTEAALLIFAILAMIGVFTADDDIKGVYMVLQIVLLIILAGMIKYC